MGARHGAPGALRPSTRVVTVTLRRSASPPAPHVLDLRARRFGEAIIVTWRTDRAGTLDDFLVTGARTRAADAIPIAVGLPKGEKPSRSLQIGLLAPAPAAVRHVGVYVGTPSGRIIRRAVTAVR